MNISNHFEHFFRFGLVSSRSYIVTLIPMLNKFHKQTNHRQIEIQINDSHQIGVLRHVLYAIYVLWYTNMNRSRYTFHKCQFPYTSFYLSRTYPLPLISSIKLKREVVMIITCTQSSNKMDLEYSILRKNQFLSPMNLFCPGSATLFDNRMEITQVI